jgi:DNA-binding LacI/PurR family transcriptional regulator
MREGCNHCVSLQGMVPAQITEAGLRIPQDISIIGFDDIPMAQYSNPPLTTLQMPVREISLKACDALLKLTSGKMSKSSVIKVKPILVVRSSTGPTGDSSIGGLSRR